MLRRRFLALLPSPLIRWFGSGLPWNSGLSGQAEPPVNAAELYRGAFDWVRGLPSADQDLLDEARAVNDPHLDWLLDQAQPMLSALRTAARAKVCCWEPAEITSAQDLGRGQSDMMNTVVIKIACWSAGRLARAGLGREALDDLFAALALARRVGTGGIGFTQALGYSFELKAMATLGHILPRFDRVTLDDLEQRLEDLPEPEPASRTVELEARYLLSTCHEFVAALGATIGADQWSDLFPCADVSALERITGGQSDRFLAYAEAAMPSYVELGRLLDLPRSESRAAFDAFAREEAAGFLVAADLIRDAWGVRVMRDNIYAYRMIALAAVALVRDGESAFRTVRDPFGDGPFGLERRGPISLIRSAIEDKASADVMLVIGEPE